MFAKQKQDRVGLGRVVGSCKGWFVCVAALFVANKETWRLKKKNVIREASIFIGRKQNKRLFSRSAHSFLYMYFLYLNPFGRSGGFSTSIIMLLN